MKYRRNILTLGDRLVDPINALDYPALIDDSKWVICARRGQWPDADRRLFYISKSQRDPMRGFYLLTPSYRDAARFDTDVAASAFLFEQDRLRGQVGPWNGLEILSVEKLKLAHGFYVEVDG